MRTLHRTLGAIVFLAIVFVAGSLAYSTWSGHTRWYFRVDGQVVVNGRTTAGYLHANTEKTILMLTRTDDPEPETYLIWLGGPHSASDCGEWHPLRFLPTAVGDVKPPCSVFITDPATVHDPIIPATLTSGRNFVEFTTASGKKVRGQW
jgi:hypothetical protein